MRTTKRRPTRADLDRVLRAVFDELLERGERERQERPYGEAPHIPELPDDDDEPPQGPGPQPEDEAEYYRACLQVNDLYAAAGPVERALEAQGLTRPEDNDEYRRLLRDALISLAGAAEIDAQRERGIYRPPVHPLLSGPAAAPSPAASSPTLPERRLLSEEMGRYFERQTASGLWQSDMQRDSREALKVWLSLRGDVQFDALQKSDALDFRTALMGLPARRNVQFYSVHDATKQIALRKEIEAALKRKSGPVRVAGREFTREQAEDHARTITRSTANRYLNFFRSFYAERVEHGDAAVNPFEGALFNKREVAQQTKPRLPWEPDQLRTLFASPVWRGSASAWVRTAPGPTVYEDDRFWVPLIGLFTGLRRDEICDLKIADVTRDDTAGCWLLHVREGKTAAARRRVPVHPELEKIGFVRYIQAVKKGRHARLFPALRGNTDTAGNEFGKWFGRYRKICGVYEPGRDFHSFRHTFKTEIGRRFRGNDLVVNALVGHEAQGMDRVYFHGFTPRDLFEAICQVRYDGLDLSPLHLDNQPGRVILTERGAEKAQKST